MGQKTCSVQFSSRQRIGRGSRCDREAHLRRWHELHGMRWVARSEGHLPVSPFSSPKEEGCRLRTAWKRRWQQRGESSYPCIPPNPHLHAAPLLGSAPPSQCVSFTVALRISYGQPCLSELRRSHKNSAQTVYPGSWHVLRDAQHGQRGMHICPDTSQE